MFIGYRVQTAGRHEAGSGGGGTDRPDILPGRPRGHRYRSTVHTLPALCVPINRTYLRSERPRVPIVRTYFAVGATWYGGRYVERSPGLDRRPPRTDCPDILRAPHSVGNGHPRSVPLTITRT